MREELALDCDGMLPATECSTKMMALTSAGCELDNLRGGKTQERLNYHQKETGSENNAVLTHPACLGL